MVSGTGFFTGSVVTWNGTPLATSFISARQLSAAVPAALVATAQTGSVNVVNAAPGGGKSNTVFVQVNTPTATVSFPNYYLNPFVSPTSAVLTADVNRDGKADVVFAADQILYVMYGNGDGTFGTPVGYPAPAGQFIDGIAVGDFNGDSLPDIAVATGFGGFQGGVYVLFGTPQGTFVPGHADYKLANYPGMLSTADLNGDGKLDLVVGYGSGGVISVLPGNGDGTFAARTDYATGGSPLALVLADFNNDGAVDIAVSDTLIGATTLLLNNGDGTFRTGHGLQVLDAKGIAAGDFNHDGNVDLAIESNFEVSIYLGNGDGTFRAPISTPSTDIYQPSLIVGDFNADGNLDLALIYSDISPEIYLGNGDGTFQAALQLPLVSPAAFPAALAAADFNNDGRLDLVTTEDGSGLSILLSSTLELSTSTVSFGSVLIGSTAPAMTVTLTNVGSTPISLGNLTLTGANPADFPLTTTCGSSLAANATCTASLTFTPTLAGYESATLTIPNNTLGLSQFVTVQGDGIGVSLTPAKLNFGAVTVGQTSTLNAILTNLAGTPLTIGTINTASNPDFSETNTCGTSLAAHASCTISVTFMPQTTGPLAGALIVRFRAIGSPEFVRLLGTGQ